MSQPTNTSVINFCDVCNLSFESKKGLYRHQSYDLKHKELLEKIFESEEEEISERVYNLDEDDYIIKTKPATKPKTKASIGSYIDLPPDLKNSKSILNIRSYKNNCLQLTMIAWLHPAPHYATRESKYEDKLIEPRQQHENYFDYIIRIQKLYNINIWVYTPCGNGKIELFKQVDDFKKDRKDVRILVWSNGQIEHCALIKKIETLLERQNKNNIKYYYCDRCTYWVNSQIKNDKHECSTSFKPEIVCPKKKHITFVNEHKCQNIKNIITADIECCIVDPRSGFTDV